MIAYKILARDVGPEIALFWTKDEIARCEEALQMMTQDKFLELMKQDPLEVYQMIRVVHYANPAFVFGPYRRVAEELKCHLENAYLSEHVEARFKSDLSFYMSDLDQMIKSPNFWQSNYVFVVSGMLLHNLENGEHFYTPERFGSHCLSEVGGLPVFTIFTTADLDSRHLSYVTPLVFYGLALEGPFKFDQGITPDNRLQTDLRPYEFLIQFLFHDVAHAIRNLQALEMVSQTGSLWADMLYMSVLKSCVENTLNDIFALYLNPPDGSTSSSYYMLFQALKLVFFTKCHETVDQLMVRDESVANQLEGTSLDANSICQLIDEDFAYEELSCDVSALSGLDYAMYVETLKLTIPTAYDAFFKIQELCKGHRITDAELKDRILSMADDVLHSRELLPDYFDFFSLDGEAN